MKKFGNTWIIEEEGPKIDEVINNQLKDKAIICLSFFPNGQKTWPNDKRMLLYCQYKIRKLKELGLINDELLNHFVESEKSVFIAAEFKDKDAALKTFKRAISPGMGIIDIYLFDKGVCIGKYD